ncbi:MAG: 50S ribosomal protein L11 methyltransferase [Blastocatellia bacterium]
MKRSEKDEQLAARLPGVLQYHETMLADGVRNRLLYKAIKKKVTAETSFLDAGAGTGAWAILAAKLGAKRVVAIEIEECLIPIIHKHAQENSVAGRIEIIHGDTKNVKIRGKFDVIVSELFGGDALGKDTVDAFIYLRDKYLAPVGELIPQKLAMLAVPVHFDGSVQNIPADLPFETSFLRSLKLNYSQIVPLAERSRIKFLAEPKALIELDFRTVAEAPSLANLTASWKIKGLKYVNAIVAFNRSTFSDRIEMDAFDSQSWGVVLYEFQPFQKTSGELYFRLTIDPKQGNWAVGSVGMPEQTFSPVFAFTRLRMAQVMTPHHKFKAPKKNQPEVKK